MVLLNRRAKTASSFGTPHGRQTKLDICPLPVIILAFHTNAGVIIHDAEGFAKARQQAAAFLLRLLINLKEQENG
jgi:hypothetical protein